MSGDRPAYSKLGRRVIYVMKDLKEWVASKRVLSTSEYQPKKGEGEALQDAEVS